MLTESWPYEGKMNPMATVLNALDTDMGPLASRPLCNVSFDDLFMMNERASMS